MKETRPFPTAPAFGIDRPCSRCRSARRIDDTKGHKKELAPVEPVHDIVHVKAITYTAAREKLAATMQRVCEDHSPVVITRRRDQAVVMMALDDYEALEETSYLLRSPRNARRLREAVDQLRKGKGKERKLPALE